MAAAIIGAAPTLALAGETTTYTYDALGRLTSATSSGSVNNGLATTIGYDPAGNRQSYHVVAGAGGGTPAVIDGSFEDPPQNGGYTYMPTVTGATFTAGAGVAGNGSAWGFTAAPDGGQVAFIASDATHQNAITLNVTGLTAGTTYSVHFYTAQRPGYDGAPITVSFNGTALGTFTPASTSFTPVSTASFVASGTTGTITFQSGLTAAYTASAIDAVTIAAVANGASVADGSFETPALGGSGYVNRPSTVAGLSFTGWSGITSNSSDWQYSAAPDGAQAAFMDIGPDGVVVSITMAVSGLTPGASYRIGFQMARRPLYTPAVVRVAINGNTLGDYTPVATTNAFTGFTTPNFTATGTSATLTFTGIAQGDVAIDQVSVAAAAPASIVDASFETPALGGTGYVNRPTSVAGLSFTGWSGITSNSSDWQYSAAPDGTQAAFMDIGPDGVVVSITMAVSDLTPGAAYRIGFQMARRPLYTPAVVRVAINGATLGDYTPVATTNAFTAFTTPTFTATGASATLTFTGIAQGDVAIDKVSVGP